METSAATVKDAEQRKAMQERIAQWRAKAARYESDPQTKEGRKEMSHRAKEAGAMRDRSEKKHHRYELGSGCFEIAIVLTCRVADFRIGFRLLCGRGGSGGYLGTHIPAGRV